VRRAATLIVTLFALGGCEYIIDCLKYNSCSYKRHGGN
jgi:hypothetical protein